MGVMTTQEAELIRQFEARKNRVKWELFSSPSLPQTLHFARDNGWAEDKVQVKAYRINHEEFEYHVEPFEKDCHCPNLLHYSDYFNPPEAE